MSCGQLYSQRLQNEIKKKVFSHKLSTPPYTQSLITLSKIQKEKKKIKRKRTYHSQRSLCVQRIIKKKTKKIDNIKCFPLLLHKTIQHQLSTSSVSDIVFLLFFTAPPRITTQPPVTTFFQALRQNNSRRCSSPSQPRKHLCTTDKTHFRSGHDTRI